MSITKAYAEYLIAALSENPGLKLTFPTDTGETATINKVTVTGGIDKTPHRWRLQSIISYKAGSCRENGSYFCVVIETKMCYNDANRNSRRRKDGSQ